MYSVMTWKILGVSLYLIILIVIGIVASRRMKDIRDYFAAGKKLGFLAVAFSARATGESAWLLLGLTGMGAFYGVHAFWVVFGEVLGVAGAWLFLSRRFKRLTDEYDSITIPDYLESRFRDTSHIIRIVSAVALLVFVTIYVSAQIDATGQAFESFLNWNYFVGAIVGFAVVTVYITSGGFLAVAWSDVFQGSLMLIGLVCLPIVGLIEIGGVSELGDKLHSVDPNLLSLGGKDGYSLMGIMGILSLALIGLGFLGSPQIFVRFLSMKSEGEITKGATTAIVWTLLADSGAVLIGMIGRALYTTAKDAPEAILGESCQNVLSVSMDLLPAFVVGIYIAIVLAAIMSTADSLLVLASSAVVRDYYQKVKNPHIPDEALVSHSRKVTLILALSALAIAMAVAVISPSRSVFWFVIFGWSGISATFCPVIILSLFWSRLTLRGALAAMITGFFSVIFFKFIAPDLPAVGDHLSKLSELPPSFALAGLMGVVISVLDKSGLDQIRNASDDLAMASRK